jgi:hypothetical protein
MRMVEDDDDLALLGTLQGIRQTDFQVAAVLFVSRQLGDLEVPPPQLGVAMIGMICAKLIA